MMPFVFGTSERMKDLERKTGFIARSGLPVLLEGACGTGKEMLAELLHELSGKAGGFVRVLCRQSGLVIHAPLHNGNGAADLGQFYQTAKGTLFLKDVHLLTPAVQEQFLTVLEQQSDSPDANSNPLGVRLISSTTEALDPFIERRQFLAGLYYRLSVCRLSLPPLRERVQDIPELFATMLRRYSNGAGEPPCPARLLDALASHTWPGNVRELLNVARTYVVTRDVDQIVAELGGLLPTVHPAGASDGVQLSLKEQVRGASQKLETEIILRTLERHRWNRRRAAQSLRISYRSLLYKMKNCNLRVETQTTPEGTE